MENTVDAFDFNALKEAVGVDPFAKQANKYAKDERFYTLSKDKEGNGAALIRFLPDSNKRMIIQLAKINTTITKNGKKRFVSKYTPATIGLPCPFQEKWQELWNAGDKEGAKVFSRGLRYVANIKILKDPANPENEGKIFLYDFSGAINSKLEKALNPSASDMELGKTAKQLFNPVKGNSFRLVAQRGANGQINYDASEVVPEETAVYTTVEEAIADIKENTYSLGDLLKPESFPTYDELVQDFKRVTFADQEEKPVAQTAPAVETTQAAQAEPVAPVTPAVQATPATQAAPVVETTQAAPVQETKTAVNANDDLDAILQGLV